MENSNTLYFSYCSWDFFCESPDSGFTFYDARLSARSDILPFLPFLIVICCLRSSLPVRQSLGQKHEPWHVQDQELESYQYHFAIDERKMEKESVVHHKVDISTTDEADHQEISKAEITAWSIFELIGFSFAIVLTIYSIYFVVYLLFFKSGNKFFWIGWISFLNFRQGSICGFDFSGLVQKS